MPAWDFSTTARHHFGRLWDRLVDLTGVANPPLTTHSMMQPSVQEQQSRIEFIRPPEQFSNIASAPMSSGSTVQRNVAFDDRQQHFVESPGKMFCNSYELVTNLVN